jgi:hypothetical protein
MSTDVVAKSRGLSRWALRLTLLVAFSGCTITKEWSVYHAYDGNTRSLNEVAVVLARYGVTIVEVDGSRPRKQGARYTNGDTEEYHLPPGHHNITASYSHTDYFEGRHYSGKPITIPYDFSAGTVYSLWAKTPTRYVFGGSRNYGLWSLDIFAKGSVDEVACSKRFDPPKGDLVFDLLRTIYVPPAHWIELRKLHCPDKIVSPDQ